MNACEVCGDTPVCKTGLCPACTADLWTGQLELKLRKPYVMPMPNTSSDFMKLYNYHKSLNIQPYTHISTGNRNCSQFLGITVAEHVLSNVFKNVVRAPMGNRGFDFWCNNGFKIDVKSSCIRRKKIKHSSDAWSFKIKRNEIADYFLCIAFDNREDLSPLHLWLIPGKDINTKLALSISASTLSKLDAYKLDINKTITCCDAMKS